MLKGLSDRGHRPCGVLGLAVLFGWMPRGLRFHGCSRIGSARPHPLVVTHNGLEGPLDGGLHPSMEHEQIFEASRKHVKAMFEVGLECPPRPGAGSNYGRSGRGHGLSCGGFGIECVVRPIGEQPVHGDQDEMREELLFDAALGFGMKLLDEEQALAHLVEFLDAPTGMVEIHELLERIPLLGADQGGAQAKSAAGHLIFQKPQAQRDDGEIRIDRPDVSLRACGGEEGDRGVGVRAGKKLLNLLEPAVLETKHGVDPGGPVLMQQDVGEIASIVHHDIVGLQHSQVPQGAPSLVAMRDEVEIPGHLRREVVEATQQPLRIVCIVRGQGVATRPQRAGQCKLGAIDGKHPMAQPSVVGVVWGIGVQNVPVDGLENGFVQFATCDTKGRRRDAVGLRERERQVVATVPQVINGGAVTLGVG